MQIVAFLILGTFLVAAGVLGNVAARRLRDDQAQYTELRSTVQALLQPFPSPDAARAAVAAVPPRAAVVLLVHADTSEPWACNVDAQRALMFGKPPGRKLEGDGWEGFLANLKARQTRLEGRVKWDGAYGLAYGAPVKGTPYLVVAVSPSI